MKYQMEQKEQSVQISIVTAAAAATTTATTAENPPRCTAIYFSTHKLVKRIALVFSNIYRFVCSSFAVVVCIFTSLFVFLLLSLRSCSLVFAFCILFMFLVQRPRYIRFFSTVVILLCGRERNHSCCVLFSAVYILLWLECFTVFMQHTLVVLELDAGYSE